MVEKCHLDLFVSEVRPDGTLRVRTVNTEPSKTDRQYKEQVDINSIMKKYDGRMGNVPDLGRRGVFVDLSKMPVDYAAALNLVEDANAAFETLPVEVKKKFRQNPAELLNFVADKRNEDEARRLGLLPPKKDGSEAGAVASTPPVPAAPKKTRKTIIEEEV